MDESTLTDPAPSTGRRAQLAVAIGNASLLGIGYLMLGRRRLAAAAGGVTLVLLVIAVVVLRTFWVEVVVVVWWAAMIAHGWVLAGRSTRPGPSHGLELAALVVTVAVLASVALLRVDASGIEGSVDRARAGGDCTRAEQALGTVDLGHRIADAPLTARLDVTGEVCGQLRTASGELSAALAGTTGALQPGLDGLASVLARRPGHEPMVDTTLNRFLDGLPVTAPCTAVTLTDQLRARPPSNDTLDRSAAEAARTAPTALVECADARMAGSDWPQALTLYQQAVTRYPGNPLVTRARQGVTRAVQAIELDRVRDLLAPGAGALPAYCSRPARYSGARPYAKGTSTALITGPDSYTSRLPPQWLTDDPAKAVLVVCAGAEVYGAPVQTCPYRSEGPGRRRGNVTFHRIAIPIKAYELRTGRLVADTRVEIGGVSCPDTIETASSVAQLGPPPDFYVQASDDDVRAAFAPLITR